MIYSLSVIFLSQVAFDKRGHGLILIRIEIRKTQWHGEGVSSFPVDREKSIPLTVIPTPGPGPLRHIWQKLFPRCSSGSSGVGEIAETYGSGKTPSLLSGRLKTEGIRGVTGPSCPSPFAEYYPGGSTEFEQMGSYLKLTRQTPDEVMSVGWHTVGVCQIELDPIV